MYCEQARTTKNLSINSCFIKKLGALTGLRSGGNRTLVGSGVGGAEVPRVSGGGKGAGPLDSEVVDWVWDTPKYVGSLLRARFDMDALAEGILGDWNGVSGEWAEDELSVVLLGLAVITG